MTNPYLDLTAAFNRGRTRALLSSGQAVVMHRLAIMSKDGDWILREDEESIGVIGELARKMTGLRSQLLWSRSSQDLIRLAGTNPDEAAQLVGQRPLLARVPEGRDALDEALDRERRGFIRANQERLARYRRAAERWGAVWPEVAREISSLPLADAHAIVAARAEGILPFAPAGGSAQ